MKNKNYIVLLLLSIICFSSCNDDPTSENAEKPSPEQTEMLENYADNFIIPSYQTTKSSLDAFSNELDSNNGSDLNKLKDLFTTLYLDWEASNFYNFGPANSNSLENTINIYPTDTTLVNTNISSDLESLSSVSADAKGLPAIDFILYTNDTLSENQVDYLKLIVSDIDTRLTKTISDWNTTYRDAFVVNGGFSTGSATSFILNSFIQYFEKTTRDGKLGIPLGIRSLGDKLPEKSEGFYSGLSEDLLEANITALKNFFKGGSEYGLDDLLKSSASTLEEEEVDEITLLWDSLEDQAESVTEPISDYVINNDEDASDFYKLIQQQLVLLKINVTSALGVKITYQDTDGD